jgi:hypothetical protein
MTCIETRSADLPLTFGNDPPRVVQAFPTFRGERDAAFQWLDRAYTQKDFLMGHVKSEWALNGLESDARYETLMRKMHLQE